jgi:N-acylglucosamine 2-epimerase
MDFTKYAEQYRDALLQDVIPFWLQHSIDKKYGGFFTCLDRDGRVFDTDKFMWLQGRQVWTFSMLYNQVERRKEWLDIALHGADFMEKYGRADDESWYFSLTQEGRPLIAPYNIFSDCFATQAFGQLHLATGIDRYGEIALRTFRSILDRQHNSKRQWSKAVPGTRPTKNFALPMILCNLGMEIRHLISDAELHALADTCIHEVMEVFYDHDSGLILENVAPDGRFVDSFEGRSLNPGHAIEAMWFIIDIAATRNDHKLIDKAKDIILHTIDYAWDKQYQGLYYFMDIKGAPPQQLEWDQKLWWVHIETLIALLKAYRFTRDERCLQRFQMIHEYSWSRFADPEYGEWYGYLSRQGTPLLSLKGGKWKGCYHVPRGLYQCWKTLEEIAK